MSRRMHATGMSALSKNCSVHLHPFGVRSRKPLWSSFLEFSCMRDTDRRKPVLSRFSSPKISFESWGLLVMSLWERILSSFWMGMEMKSAWERSVSCTPEAPCCLINITNFRKRRKVPFMASGSVPGTWPEGMRTDFMKSLTARTT